MGEKYGAVLFEPIIPGMANGHRLENMKHNFRNLRCVIKSHEQSPAQPMFRAAELGIYLFHSIEAVSPEVIF
jgi:hypothetical protein